MNYLTTLIALAAIAQACSGQDFLTDDKHLIGGYYYFEAGPQSCIVYNGRDKYRGTGAEVVPGKVIETSLRGHYLLVTSMNVMTQEKTYWVIDASRDIKAYYRESMPQAYYDSVLTSNRLGPLDIDQFSTALDTLPE